MTILYCPICDSPTECIVKSPQPSDRIIFFQNPFINAYLRERTCKQCGDIFKTYEIDDTTFDALRKICIDAKVTKIITKRPRVKKFPNEAQERIIGVHLQLSKSVDEALNALSKTQRNILYWGLGLGLEKAVSKPEICRKLGISLKKLYDIESKALRRLRHPSKFEKLRKFLTPDIVRKLDLNQPEVKLLQRIFGKF